MDPLCGWSYANSANFVKFYKEYKDEYDFEILVGGIKLGEECTTGGPDMLEYIKRKGRRITQLSGAKFSDEYFSNLASNEEYVFDSFPSSIAIVTVKYLNNEAAILYADELQRTQFEEGKDNNCENVLADIAMKFGINRNEFLEMYRSERAMDLTLEDFVRVREIGVDSFPVMYLQSGDDIKLLAKGYLTMNEMEKSLAFCFKNLRDIKL